MNVLSESVGPKQFEWYESEFHQTEMLNESNIASMESDMYGSCM